jgi:glucan phosphoethanolaminetransferase (alkaline phosphatase superfamily)
MPTIDPRFLLIFSLIFVGLAGFNLYLGIKRLRQAREQGEKLRWYKQLSILTGIEYFLLAFAFVGSLSISNGWIPTSLRTVVLPLYVIMLLFAVALAGVVVFQNSKARRERARVAALATTRAAAPAAVVAAAVHTRSLEEQERALQRRRQRRQNAATARRKRAGKA